MSTDSAVRSAGAPHRFSNSVVLLVRIVVTVVATLITVALASAPVRYLLAATGFPHVSFEEVLIATAIVALLWSMGRAALGTYTVE